MSKKKKKREFVARVPVPVRGGIHIQSLRPQASRKWWAKRWLEFMEELKMGARLGRGRSYAISGQVIALEVVPGLVSACVQGGSAEAYRCELKFDVMPDDVKTEILSKLHAKPLLLAQLLVHNLPPSVDRMFRAAGYPLIPSSVNSFEAVCSCPDYADLCKHVAAVLFLLTEAFEQDPLRLLTLRGITRDDLIGNSGTQDVRISEDPKNQTPEHPNLFWGEPPKMKLDFGSAPTAAGKTPLVKRLGIIPFWRGDQRFFEAMDQCGERFASAGWRVWAGELPKRDTVARVDAVASTRMGKVRATRLDEM